MRLGTIILSIALLIAACNRTADNKAQKPVPRVPAANAPFVYIYVMPGYKPPFSMFGVLAAVWEDGTIARATSEADVGKSYIKGKLTQEQVAHVHQLLEESGILSVSTDLSRVIVDADAESLTVCSDAKARTWAHSPGFENAGNAVSIGPRITQIKLQLMALPISGAVSEPGEQWARYPHAWLQ